MHAGFPGQDWVASIKQYKDVQEPNVLGESSDCWSDRGSRLSRATPTLCIPLTTDLGASPVFVSSFLLHNRCQTRRGVRTLTFVGHGGRIRPEFDPIVDALHLRTGRAASPVCIT